MSENTEFEKTIRVWVDKEWFVDVRHVIGYTVKGINILALHRGYGDEGIESLFNTWVYIEQVDNAT